MPSFPDQASNASDTTKLETKPKLPEKTSDRRAANMNIRKRSGPFRFQIIRARGE